MKVSIIGGTGDLGFGLALRLAKAGVEVVIGSRKGEKAAQAAQRLTEMVGDVKVEGRVNREAVHDCRFVFFTIPYGAIEEIANDVAPQFKKDCIVVSCIVPMQEREVSAAEFLASRLPSHVKVVSALHTVAASIMKDLNRPVDVDTFIFGDGLDEKRAVAKLLYCVEGLRPVDGGPLKNSRYGEAFTRFLIEINRRYSIKDAGLKIKGLSDEAVKKRWSA